MRKTEEREKQCLVLLAAKTMYNAGNGDDDDNQ